MTPSLTTTYMGCAVGKYEEVQVSCPFIHSNCSSAADKREKNQAEAAVTQGISWTQQGLQKHSKLRIYHMFSAAVKTGMLKPQQTHTENTTVFACRESGTWICLKKGQQVLLSSLTDGILYSGMPLSQIQDQLVSLTLQLPCDFSAWKFIINLLFVSEWKEFQEPFRF